MNLEKKRYFGKTIHTESTLKLYKDELNYERAERRKKKEKNLILYKMNGQKKKCLLMIRKTIIKKC